MEIHPCVLQDIGPLGPLPCSHSTSSANHSKQGIGYRWPCAILGWLVYPCGISHARTLMLKIMGQCPSENPSLTSSVHELSSYIIRCALTRISTTTVKSACPSYTLGTVHNGRLRKTSPRWCAAFNHWWQKSRIATSPDMRKWKVRWPDWRGTSCIAIFRVLLDSCISTD